ncbi:DUF4132 domain-containing protein [Acidovorax sp. 1608163]|uniref:DUF4132 domain-containing protein n=1 Tax=Acidovorax sp. 1608163 TaxID=2478662 RepID=UPI000EF64945|nr:DUF4132 domain-containing protein [Acidovorax sp. 1608163]AYM98401.1 DUF4132 domain-containing protein [Acidovorax sp. 1608163]
MGLLDKMVKAVLGSTTSDAGALTASQVNLLRQAMEPLGTLSAPRVAERALAFITEGIEEGVLQDLASVTPSEVSSNLLGQPGRLRWGFHAGHGGKSQSAGDKSMAGRAAFYDSVAKHPVPLEVIVRLGKVLAAGDQGKSLDHPGAPIPDWLQYLVNDALHASFGGHSNQHDLTQRRAWRVPLFAQLLAHEGLDETLVLQLVFERKGLDSYYSDRFRGLVEPTEVAEYMRDHPEAVRALLQQLSASGKVELARRIGQAKNLTTAFAPELVALAVDGAKTTRAEAVKHLEGIPTEDRLRLLGALLREGETTQRTQAAELLARWPADTTAPLLEAALESETSKPVQQAIRAALNRLGAASDAQDQALPPAPEWTPFADAPLGDAALQLFEANRKEVVERARKAAEEEIQSNKDAKHKYTWCQQHYAKLGKVSTEDLQAALKLLNGEGDKKDAQRVRNGEVANVVSAGNRLYTLPGFGPVHLVRWLTASHHWRSFWADDGFQKWLGQQPAGSVDLRALAAVFQRAGLPLEDVARAALCDYWNTPNAVDVLPPEQIWPFFAEHPEFIDEGLGLVAPPKRERNHWPLEMGATMRVLAVFPYIPARWMPRLMELALGEGKTHRPLAQKALAGVPDIGRSVIDSLAHTKSEVRIEAARWLADLKHTAAVPALTQALDKESRETVRAALLTALEALGEDIAPRLAPALLLAEAKKGLKAKPPAGLAWFAMEGLPAARWADGSAVEPEITRWWVVLACKLKEPGGNALLTRYMGLLDSASRQALGSTVLRQFIAQDTRHPPLEEGIAYAHQHAAGRYQSYQRGYQNAKPEYRQYYEANYAKSQEQVFEECKREKMGEYLGSAIGEKGILALAAHAPGHELVTLLQHYMRDHYQRRAQIEAMLEGAAPGNDPLVIQLLLGLSRRYRTASVQTKARTLVQEIADRNGWTQEQLADRTIPTAGLDDTGTLALPYGDRTFTMVLDVAMKPELRNPEGKPIKALPEPRQNDDPAQTKDTKAQLSSSKKELKQVIDLQTARLFEAMCTGRVWPQAEWTEYLQAHPIAGRLIQRLVWMELDAQGQCLQTFRPTEDGSLINTDDDEVTLAGGSALRLAHASVLDDAQASAWTAHFKDYKLTPLFAQMARKAPDIALADDKGVAVREIKDREGWVSDTFTLRGTFTKLGYQRAQAEDGGFFYQYTKEFASAGVRVVMEFSGNCLPEENVAAALKTLSFENSKQRSWGDHSMPLAEVPPVLLAEAYGDYLALAKVCAGYDAEWEKKMPW